MTLPFMELRLQTLPSNKSGREDSQLVLSSLEDCLGSIQLGGMFMTNLRRLPALLPFSALFITPGISSAQPHAPIAEQIGKAYGVDSFGQVEAIRYTFNIPDFKLSRTWVWEPKTDTVSYEGTDKEGKPVKA